MMENNRLFERYLFKKLDAKELQDFERRLLNDAEFRNEFNNHKNLQISFDLLLEDEVLEVIQNIKKSKDFNLNRRTKVSWISKLTKVAAVLVVLVCALTALNPEQSGEEISSFGKGFIGDNNRSGSSMNIDLTLKAKQLKAIDLKFTPPVSKTNMQEVIAMISNLDQSQFTNSEKQKVEWWMALAQVGVDKEIGKKYIETIATDENHMYSERAHKVLGQYSFFNRLFQKWFS